MSYSAIALGSRTPTHVGVRPTSAKYAETLNKRPHMGVRDPTCKYLKTLNTAPHFPPYRGKC